MNETTIKICKENADSFFKIPEILFYIILGILFLYIIKLVRGWKNNLAIILFLFFDNFNSKISFLLFVFLFFLFFLLFTLKNIINLGLYIHNGLKFKWKDQKYDDEEIKYRKKKVSAFIYNIYRPIFQQNI